MFRIISKSSILFVVLIVSSFCFGQEQQTSDVKNESIYFGPKVGFSNFTGVIGLEFKYKNVSVMMGTLPAYSDNNNSLPVLDMEAGGIKYYFSPTSRSFYVGACYFKQIDIEIEEDTDGTLDYADYMEDKIFGVIVGYHWIWAKRWDLSIGLGGGMNFRKFEDKEKDLFSDDYYYDKYEKTRFEPLIDFSFGFFF